MLDLMMAKEAIHDMFMYYERDELKFYFRRWVHIFIFLLFSVGTWALSNYVFDFGCLATIVLVTITTGIVSLLYAFNIEDRELFEKVAGLIFGICTIVIIFGGIGTLATSRDSLTKIERFKPDTIVHSNKSCVIVIYGDQTRTSYSAKDYNNPNLMMCKEMRWNDWNIRISDRYYICE